MHSTRHASFWAVLALTSLVACTTEQAPDATPDASTEEGSRKQVTAEVEYVVDDVTCKGYLAVPDGDASEAPGVLIVHEWWGHNDYVRQRADMLAKLGYVAFALDMYGEGKKTGHPKEAGEFMTAALANLDTAEKRFAAAKTLLSENCDATRMAAIGYCFGGGVVLHMARRGTDLAGVASFHGTVAPQGDEAKEGDIRCKILVCHGGADPLVPMQQLEDFRAEMAAAGADATVHVYPEAKHAFTNPGADAKAEEFELAALGYDADADRESWDALVAFLGGLFAR